MTENTQQDGVRAKSDGRIVVKVISKTPTRDNLSLRHQLPSASSAWGRCEFCFDSQAREYDWLVVYDDVPTKGEPLACPAEHTLLITVEPPSIKVYGDLYTNQFGAVLTSQRDWAIRHPQAIRQMPCLRWFYGRPRATENDIRRFQQIRDCPTPPKDQTISATCSSKRMRHTLHRARYEFVHALQSAIPDLDIYGHGIRSMDDKAESIDPYRYHIAIENYLGPDHITEKLTDAYLGGALPFYFGAPNASDYFPEQSYIPIDIRKPGEAIDQVKNAIANNAYEQRLPAIQEAKRRVLEEHNLFAVLSREIERLDTGKRGANGDWLINRRVLRRKHPINAIGYFFDRYRVQARARKDMRA